MARDDTPAVRRYPCDGVLDFPLERIEPGEIRDGVGPIICLAGWIDRDQRVADIGDINLGIGDGLPGVRIGPAVRVVVIVPLVVLVGAGTLERHDVPCRNHDRSGRAGCLHQTIQPALEAQAVDENDPGFRNLLRICRRWRIDMRIAVGAHQGSDIDTLAADIADKIAEDGKGRDGVELGRRRLLRGERQDAHCSEHARRHENSAGRGAIFPQRRHWRFCLPCHAPSRFEVASGKELARQAADAAEQEREHVERAGHENDGRTGRQPRRGTTAAARHIRRQLRWPSR